MYNVDSICKCPENKRHIQAAHYLWDIKTTKHRAWTEETSVYLPFKAIPQHPMSRVKGLEQTTSGLGWRLCRLKVLLVEGSPQGFSRPCVLNLCWLSPVKSFYYWKNIFFCLEQLQGAAAQSSIFQPMNIYFLAHGRSSPCFVVFSAPPSSSGGPPPLHRPCAW